MTAGVWPHRATTESANFISTPLPNTHTHTHTTFTQETHRDKVLVASERLAGDAADEVAPRICWVASGRVCHQEPPPVRDTDLTCLNPHHASRWRCCHHCRRRHAPTAGSLLGPIIAKVIVVVVVLLLLVLVLVALFVAAAAARLPALAAHATAAGRSSAANLEHLEHPLPVQHLLALGVKV